MEFNIVENYNVLDEININLFIKDYNNFNLSINKICKKHNISYKRYLNIVDELRDKFGYCLESRKCVKYKKNCINPKYYHFDNNRKRFTITRYRKNYGYFKTEEECINYVEWLKKHNWDKDLFNEYLGKKTKNYSFNGFSYVVIKNGKYIKSCNTENEAKKLVKYMRENNWDKNALERFNN